MWSAACGPAQDVSVEIPPTPCALSANRIAFETPAGESPRRDARVGGFGGGDSPVIPRAPAGLPAGFRLVAGVLVARVVYHARGGMSRF